MVLHIEMFVLDEVNMSIKIRTLRRKDYIEEEIHEKEILLQIHPSISFHFSGRSAYFKKRIL